MIPASIAMLMRSENYEHVESGLALSMWTFLLTVLLEICSFDTVQKLLKQRGAGYRLYTIAIMTNLRNHFLFGSPLYVYAVLNLCKDTNESPKPLTPERLASVAAILFIHSLCFYAVHRAFHEIPALYRFHKFHHRFNTHVTPISANAVGFVEYIFAYIFPFSVAGVIVQPYANVTRFAIYTVSMFNLVIHTPSIEAWSEQNMPDWWVSTHDHLEHHRKLNVHYAAPTVNLDWAVDKLTGSGNESETQVLAS